MKFSISVLLVFVGIFIGMELQSKNTSASESKLATYPELSRHFIFIRGQRWNLEVVANSPLQYVNNAYGITSCSNHTIYLEPNLSVMAQRDAILHEILHAGTCDNVGNVHNNYWNSETDNGHEGIYKISDFMSSVLHDNPELTLYLAGN